MKLELAGRQRAAQVDFHVAAHLRVTIHFLLEEAMHAAAFGLRAVQRHVGIAEQFFAGIAVTGRDRDADAGPDHGFKAIDLVRLAQGLDDLDRTRADVVRRHVAPEDHRELVAAKSRHQIVLACIRRETRSHQRQQLVAGVMTEGIVDVLEQIEIDAEHGDAFVDQTGALEIVPQTFLEHHTVGEIRQSIMVRHVGDTGFRLAPLGNVDGRYQKTVTPLERHATTECQHLDLAAVGLQMPPVAAGVVNVADAGQRAGMFFPFVPGPEVMQFHGKERGAVIAIVTEGRVVHVAESPGLDIEHPHRHRIAVEQQTERLFAALQVGDVGQRQ